MILNIRDQDDRHIPIEDDVIAEVWCCISHVVDSYSGQAKSGCRQLDSPRPELARREGRDYGMRQCC